MSQILIRLHTYPQIKGLSSTDLLVSCLPTAIITGRLSAYTLKWSISLPSLSSIHCTALWSVETFHIRLQDHLMPSKCPCHHKRIQQVVTSDTLSTRQFVTWHCRVITEAVRSTLISELTKVTFMRSGIKFSKMSFVLQLVSLLLLAWSASTPAPATLHY